MPTSTSELTDTERQMLKFTNLTFAYRGVQEQMVREQFDMSMDGFWQKVNRLIDTEAALAACPVETHRLRRLRDGAQRARGARRVA